MNAGAANLYISAFAEGARPDPPLTVSEWSDQYRFLSQKASAEPGRWRTDRTPYLREIQDCLSPTSAVSEVVFMKGAQIGGSESGFNWLGYIMHRCPGPTMMVQPTVDMAERVSKQRIAPMIQDCPALRETIRDADSGRSNSNTLLAKEFPGGMLLMTGANSASGLRSMPIKFLFMDEVDAYPADVDGEGSPIELAVRRTSTFARRKVFKNSTPTYKHASAIEAAYLESDQRRFHVPCPACGAYQWLKWTSIKWDRDAQGRAILDSVRYICEACQEPIAEHHKTAMLAAGRWVAENPGALAAGFHLSALYSPVGWYSWSLAVKEWYEAQKNPNKLKVFVNTVLGETFELRGEDTPKWRDVYQRREEYRMCVVPARGVIVTGFCDVQKDRLEVTLCAWNRKECWVLDHAIIPGDTSAPVNGGVWRELDRLIDTQWPHETGLGLPITRVGIDSGFNTTRVYEYVRRRSSTQVIATKGQDHLTMPVGAPKPVDIRSDGKRITRGCKLWPIGSSVLKADVYGRLKLERPTEAEVAAAGWPATYIHFPMLGDEYFKQVSAEQLVLSNNKQGFARYQWVKTYPANEALDCLCGNLAMYYAMGAARWPEDHWRALELQVGASASPPEPERVHSQPALTQAQAQPSMERRKSTFW